MILTARALAEEEARKSNLGYSDSIDEALDEALKRHGSNEKVAIVPYGALAMTTTAPEV